MSSTASWKDQIGRWSVDNRAGASAVSIGCARALITYAEQTKPHSTLEIESAMMGVCRSMFRNHSPMAPLVRLLNDVLIGIAAANSVRLALDGVTAVCSQYIERIESANALAVRSAVSLIPQRATVMTVSYSSAVSRALVLAAKEGTLLKVVCMESRPLCEGQSLADFLQAAGIETEIVVDAACLAEIASTDIVLAGADSLTAHGVLNKVGTGILALSAKSAGIPAYVLADTSKVWPSAFGDPVIPQRDAAEVWPDAPASVTVKNAYYEIVPWSHVAGVVTERGVESAKEIAELGIEIQVDERVIGLLGRRNSCSDKTNY